MSATLNFGSEQLSSMELYSLQLQKAVADFTDFDSVTKAYVDDKVAQAKQELTDGASTALDTFKELEDYLTASGVAGGLVEQINALSTSIADEQARATGVEATLTSDLAAEISRAQGVENALQSEVDTTQVALGTNAVGQYQQSQASHYIVTATSFKSADELLDAQVKVNADAISAEEVRALAAEDALQADVNAKDASVRSDFASADAVEQARAVAEEARIEGKVDDEKARAEGAEATLQANIDALSVGQSSDNAAQSAEAAGIKYASFGTDNTEPYGELGYKYVADAGNHYYDGATGEPTLATHVNIIDNKVYEARSALGTFNTSGDGLYFGLPNPKFLRSDPEAKSTIAENATEALINIATHFEAETETTLSDRAAIRAEFAQADADEKTRAEAAEALNRADFEAADLAIQGDLDAQKAKQAGDKSNADADRVRIQGELDAQKGKQQSEHDANVSRLDGLDGDVAGLNTGLADETARAEGAEGALQGELDDQKSKQDGEHQENVGRLDGHDGDIQQLQDRPHDGANGGFGIQHDDANPGDNKYMYFSQKWRLYGKSDGSRLIFEYNKGDDVTPNWVSAVPFVSHQ